LLPDALRRELALPDDERRLARDAYALALLSRARRELLLVSGRRGQDGDALLPSRLLFLARPEEALGRARLFADDRREDRLPAGSTLAAPARRLPRLPRDPAITHVGVTSLGVYLRSPYAFYLERALHLERAVDDARELDPRAFGELAHDTLSALVQPALQRLRDGDALAARLTSRLDGLARARFGVRPAPAVQVQLAQLAWRLTGFAAWQAAQHAAGWRVTHAEWAPEGGVPFDVDGGRLQLTGRIDRIEIGPAGRWRIADYKAGDSGDTPQKRHGGKDGREWRDLQLPLYEVLAAPLRAELEQLGARGDPELGYVVLPRERPEGDGWWLRGEWSRDDLDRAVVTARRAGGGILRGEFDDPKDWSSRDEVFAAILGEGLLVDADDGPEDEA
jgi:ATP-dependent helicase/nuclease subunit B